MEQDSRGPPDSRYYWQRNPYSHNADYPQITFTRRSPQFDVRPLRFPGDGLDFRRPINSSEPSPESFIDLTDDSVDAERLAQPLSNTHLPSNRASRLPNFSRQIIDMTGDDAPSTPDVEFVSSRPRQRQILRWHNDQADNDEVEILNHMSSAPTSGINGAYPRAVANRNAAHRGISMYMRQLQNQHARRGEGRGNGEEAGEGRGHSSQRNYPSNFTIPNLNYISQAFALQPDHEQEQPSEDAIAPLPPAPEGFTMSPEEDDILTCPNCDEELCTGDKPQKKQVWVIKSCGHVRTLAIFYHFSYFAVSEYYKCVVKNSTNSFVIY